MSELPTEERSLLLGTIKEAWADISELREATDAPTGKRGSDAAKKVLHGCHVSVAREQERTRIIRLLKTAIDVLALVTVDSAWPAVERGRDKLRAALAKLST